MKKNYLMLVLLTISIGQVLAQFSGGDGSEDNPYQIANKTDLKELSENTEYWRMGYSYIQTEDIIFTANDFENGGDFYNDGAGFSPIGINSTLLRFYGKYNGDGHIIANLYINRPTQDHVGLFGSVVYVDFSNIEIQEGSITGRAYVGGLIGSVSGEGSISYTTTSCKVDGNTILGGLIGGNTGNSTIHITNSSSSGAITGSNTVGGLIGKFNGLIKNCYTTGNVTANNNAGGIVGSSFEGEITNSYTNGDVLAINDNAGGIIGYVEEYLTVDSCHTTGNIYGQNNVGGIAGNVYEGWSSKIINSHTSGIITGKGKIGGIVGFFQGNMISNCYTTGNIIADNQANVIGGIVGQFEGELISNCYNDISITGNNIIGGLVGSFSGKIEDCYTTGNITGNDRIGGLVGYKEHFSWGEIYRSYAEGNIVGNNNVGGLAGFLGYEGTKVVESYATGTVEGVSSIGGLLGYSSGLIENCYTTNNVLGSGLYTGGLVGNFNDYDTESMIIRCYTIGNITGKNRVGGIAGGASQLISDSYATGEVSGENDIGGVVGVLNGENEGTTVSDILFKAYSTGNITGSGNNIGGVAGRFQSEYGDFNINNCYARGTVTGNNNVGGLVGYIISEYNFNNKKIVGSFATGNVIGNENIGGLVGEIDIDEEAIAEINNCYATGNLTGNNYVGGLVGYNQNNNIDKTYSIGNVSINQGNEVGGLVGYNDGGLVTNSFYDMEVSGQSDNDGRGVPKTTLEMKTIITYTDAGWNFEIGTVSRRDDVTWKVDLGCPNDGYPVLGYQTTTTIPVNTVSLEGNTIIADEADATYKWIDCDNENTVIVGENNQSFTPTTSGNYAVEITKNNVCITTSNCTNIVTVGLIEVNLQTIDLYPNPNNGSFTLNLGEISSVNIVIRNTTGTIVYSVNDLKTNTHQLELEAPNGMYLIEINTPNERKILKMLKQ